MMPLSRKICSANHTTSLTDSFRSWISHIDCLLWQSSSRTTVWQRRQLRCATRRNKHKSTWIWLKDSKIDKMNSISVQRLAMTAMRASIHRAFSNQQLIGGTRRGRLWQVISRLARSLFRKTPTRSINRVPLAAATREICYVRGQVMKVRLCEIVRRLRCSLRRARRNEDWMRRLVTRHSPPLLLLRSTRLPPLHQLPQASTSEEWTKWARPKVRQDLVTIAQWTCLVQRAPASPPTEIRENQWKILRIWVPMLALHKARWIKIKDKRLAYSSKKAQNIRQRSSVKTTLKMIMRLPDRWSWMSSSRKIAH